MYISSLCLFLIPKFSVGGMFIVSRTPLLDDSTIQGPRRDVEPDERLLSRNTNRSSEIGHRSNNNIVSFSFCKARSETCLHKNIS